MLTVEERRAACRITQLEAGCMQASTTLHTDLYSSCMTDKTGTGLAGTVSVITLQVLLAVRIYVLYLEEVQVLYYIGHRHPISLPCNE